MPVEIGNIRIANSHIKQAIDGQETLGIITFLAQSTKVPCVVCEAAGRENANGNVVRGVRKLNSNVSGLSKALREFLKEGGLNLSPFPAEHKGSVLLEVTQAVFNGEIYKASEGKMAIIHPVAPRYSIGEEEKYEKDLKTTLANCIRTYFGAVSQYNIGGEKKPLCALSLMGCVIFGGPRDMESKVGTFLTCFNKAVQEVAEEKSSDEMDEFLKRVIICPGYLQEYDALKSELRRKIGEVKEFDVKNFVASEAALLDSSEGEMLVDKDRAGPKDRAGAGEVGKAYRRDSDAAEEGASFLVELGGQTSTDNPATEVMPTSFWRNLLGCCFGRGHN